MKNDILGFLTDYLYKIEMRYGECRAPFGWPPKIYKKRAPFFKTCYVCELIIEDEPGNPLVIKAPTEEALLDKVKETVIKHFGDMS
jgi:hypothetical protein